MSRIALTSVAALVAAVSAAPASAEGAEHSIGISGFVPVVCRASLDASLVAPASGLIALGALTEFCNSPGGYKVHVDHSPELADSTLVVDGAEIRLAGSESALVTQSDGPAMATRQVSLSLADGAVGGTLSIRISPI